MLCVSFLSPLVFNTTSFCTEVGPLSYSRMKDWMFCLRMLERIYLPIILTRKSTNTASSLSEPGTTSDSSRRKTATNKYKDIVLAVIFEVKIKVREQKRISFVWVICCQKVFLFFNICHRLILYNKRQLFYERANPVQNISHTTWPSHKIPLSRSVHVHALQQQGCTSVCYYSIGATANPRKWYAAAALSCVSGDGRTCMKGKPVAFIRNPNRSSWQR